MSTITISIHSLECMPPPTWRLWGSTMCNQVTDHSELDAVISLEQILQYIQKTYAPLSIILYGSYADGTNNLNSDFDALVITSDHEPFHDTSIVDGIPLDVFVYPQKIFWRRIYVWGFLSKSMTDAFLRTAVGSEKRCRRRCKAYFTKPCSKKSSAEIQASVDWCVKMLERAKRGDCEGMFRWHWVLIDSLEIFCDIMQHPYLYQKRH